MKLIKLFLVIVMTFGISYTQAYTWTVWNGTDKKVHVKINLACVSKGPEADFNPEEEKRLKAEDIKLGINWAAGCCLSSVEVTPEGGSTKKYPITEIWGTSQRPDPKRTAGTVLASILTAGIYPAALSAAVFCSDRKVYVFEDRVFIYHPLL